MSGVPARSPAPANVASLTIAPTAPFPTASTTYALPSNRSPRIATNRSSRASVRVSIEKPDIWRSPPGPETRAPMAAATAAGVSVSAPALRARLPLHRTAVPRSRSSAFVHAPCPRALRDLRAPLSRWRTESPPSDRLSRKSPRCDRTRRNPALDLFDDAPGSSVRGLSEVMTTTSLSFAATAPISGRFVRSRSPPHPNTVMTRRCARGRAVSSRFFSASSVWA